MGCSPGTSQSNSFRVVVSSGISPSYQQSRNASSISSCISFPVTSLRLLCDGVNRQHISPGRSFCDQTQLQTTSVCESSLRFSSVGNRRAFVRLEPTGSLRLSPTHSNFPNIGENQGELMPDTPDCPLVAQEILVQRSSQSPVRLSQETSSQVRSSISKQQTTCGSSKCSTYTSGHYKAISAEEKFFCQGFNPRCFCKEKIHQSSL
ncbi:hypothetical protein DPMN_109486 [Dreissena polymorpha]|uniref:Uncharacterized protein n=1 Tax=Dreissena polymorpha TaxID=45954 RepID=A0A9D4QM05_DREPO|nr:hypothetical protein DPMN_109486 [Dreissena polymorpha]